MTKPPDLPPRWPWITLIALLLGDIAFVLFFIGIAIYDWFSIGLPGPLVTALIPYAFASPAVVFLATVGLIPSAAEYRCAVTERRTKSGEAAR